MTSDDCLSCHQAQEVVLQKGADLDSRAGGNGFRLVGKLATPMTAMNDIDIRRLIRVALEHVKPGLAKAAMIEDYESTGSNVTIGELQLDSLEIAEFCIFLEMEYGLRVNPDDFLLFTGLNDIEEFLSGDIANGVEEE